MKILIIRLSSIGDIVLTTPVIRCIKQQVPGAEVHFLTKPAFKTLLEHNPYIDRLHLLDSQLNTTIQGLRKEAFSCIIDLHHNLRTLRIKLALGVKSYAYNKLNVEKWLLTALKINRLPPVHIVDRLLATAAPLGVVPDGQGLDYFYPTQAEKILDTLPALHLQQGYIGLVVGAALATKQLPLPRLNELCGRLARPVVLLGGPEDANWGAQLAAAYPQQVYNACGQCSLHQSAVLVKNAAVVITHDTGLMHIAAAMGRPIVSIWGNTVPALGMTPYYGTGNMPAQAIFEVKNLSCRPCSKIGYKQCPKGHFKCMQQQDISGIAAQAHFIFEQQN